LPAKHLKIELINYILIAISVGGVTAFAISAIPPAIYAAASLQAILAIVFTTQGGLTAFFALLGTAGADIIVGTCLATLQR
jgi:hypothetical protein